MRLNPLKFYEEIILYALFTKKIGANTTEMFVHL